MNAVNPKPLRLFFGFRPDPPACERMGRLLDGLPLGAAARPHHAQDLHVTLVFLGTVGAERLACVDKVAGAINPIAPFRICLDRLGYWKRPRIAVLEADDVPEPLLRLVGDLQGGLEACGFAPEQRSYRPHVTLARKARPVAIRPLDEAVCWTVGDYALFSSKGGQKPPRYEVLKRWSLGS